MYGLHDKNCKFRKNKKIAIWNEQWYKFRKSMNEYLHNMHNDDIFPYDNFQPIVIWSAF